MPTNPELRQFIVEHFNDAELTILIADYFEPYQAKEKPGLAMELRAQELISFCKRMGQIANLEAALQEKHPRLYSAEFGVLAVAPVVKQARDPRKCFVCYAYEDVEFAERLAGDLRTAGAPVWIAPHSIQPGEKWMRAIERGLKECGVFVCVLTPNALASEWVRDETEIAIGYARKVEMRILPLLVQACDPAELSVWLTPLQHIPFERHYESGLAELKSALGLNQPAAGPSPGKLANLPPSPKPATPPPKRSSLAAADSGSAVFTVEDMPMCYVPPGEFIMGSNRYGVESPEHPQKIGQGFWIGKYAVTNAQYRHFVAGDGYANADLWTEAIGVSRWRDGKFKGRDDKWREGPRQYRRPFDLANHPVVGVSWYEALAFARWLRLRLGAGTFGLPSEAQWEYAARGPRYAPHMFEPFVEAASALGGVTESQLNDFAAEIERGKTTAENRRIYPWGDDANSKKMNFSQTGIGSTSAVGAFPLGVSLFGCEDMSGNVWEWTMTSMTVDYKHYDRIADNRPDASEFSRVLRGGSFDSTESGARCAFRFNYDPNLDFNFIGFRVVASPIYL